MTAADGLPVDPALPHLPVALNAAAMAEVFARLVQQHRPGLAVEACAVDRIKYRPRRNIAVSYRLGLRDPRTGESFEQLVATRFCVASESERRHANALLRSPIASQAGPAISLVAALDMMAAWWPNDPKLGAAADLLGRPSPARDCIVAEVVAALTGGRGELVSYQVHWAQVVPENRACARVELIYRGAASASLQQQTVYAKIGVAGHGAITHAVMQALRRGEAQAQGRLLTPQPILWQAECGLQWQTALPGTPLLDQAPQVGLAAASRVGTLLAGLHSTPVPTPNSINADGLRERLRRVADTLVTVEPRWQRSVHALADLLDAGVERVCGDDFVTLHGDLHPRNVLVEGDRFGLIDLDNVHRGPAEADLGDWIADALYRALLDRKCVAQTLTSCRAFLRAYAIARGRPCSEAALAWSTANSLFCQRAWRSVVNLKPGRYALVQPLLETATAIARAGSIEAAVSAPEREAA